MVLSYLSRPVLPNFAQYLSKSFLTRLILEIFFFSDQTTKSGRGWLELSQKVTSTMWHSSWDLVTKLKIFTSWRRSETPESEWFHGSALGSTSVAFLTRYLIEEWTLKWIRRDSLILISSEEILAGKVTVLTSGNFSPLNPKLWAKISKRI